MGFYFEDHQCMFGKAGMQVERTLEGIARRYVGFNPAHPPVYRAYSRRGILRGKDYRYTVDLDKVFPNTPNEHFVYAWARYWSDAASELKFVVSCFGPIVITCNGECVFRSNLFHERYGDERHTIFIPLKAGWNHLVIRFKKTRAGFGGCFGTWLGKLPYYFLMPTAEREGQEGWIFTKPMPAELPALPGPNMTERDTGVEWLPELSWDAAHLKMGRLQRIYGLVPNASAIAWTKATFLQKGSGKYSLKGRSLGPIAVFVADKEVFRTAAAGRINATVKIPFGIHDLMVQSACKGSGWGFELSFSDGRSAVAYSSPCRLVGCSDPWIFAGPFAASAKMNLAGLRDLNKTVPSLAGDTYWRCDMPDAWVRPYNENPLYGRWNYPLGVTLYGLLHSAKAIGSEETRQYVVNHVQYCCDTFHYALWDKGQYGGATTVHHLLSSIDSLDDCGSFGSAMLEVAGNAEIRGYREIADFVANYISNKQIRLPDGTFFRKHLMHVFHEDTMWADDLYMSVPFLCRYYQLTGDRKYVDDAAHQFLGFRQHLYIPSLKVMSHVYDFKRKLATGIPWGRGNGWVIFSLSELLAVLPENHKLRPELLGMFRDLCSGYLALQDKQGMWRQVLNEPDAYPEASCTSMFTYAFARGVQYGWLENPDAYVKSVLRAWEALNRIFIDRGGNVHGVCRGSEFSFTPEYYKKELLWNLNDTHGIGIVLLAGVEVLKLMKHLQK